MKKKHYNEQSRDSKNGPIYASMDDIETREIDNAYIV